MSTEAGRLLGEMMASERGRAILREIGPAQEQPVVVCEWDDPIKDVFERVRQYAPPVVVAIHREKENELVFLGLAPVPREGTAAVASPVSTIGLLYDVVRTSETRSLTFQLSQWDAPAGLRALPAFA